jgi:VCBS repeat-containing protein
MIRVSEKLARAGLAGAKQPCVAAAQWAAGAAVSLVLQCPAAASDALEQTGAATWTRVAVGAEIVIDLRASFDVERVRVHQRNDGCCQDRLMDFTVSLLADDGAGNPGAVVQSTVFAGQPANNSFGQVTLAAVPAPATDTATLNVSINGNNDAPTVALNAVPAINENGSATLTGSFTDPDGSDTHTVTVAWGDPNNATDSTFNLSATSGLMTGNMFNSSTDSAVLMITGVLQSTGQVSFSVQHQYLDDGVAPGNNTASDTSTIKVTVTDPNTGSGMDTTTVTVNDVAPVGVDDAYASYTVDEDAILTATALGATPGVLDNDTDMGTLDAHTVTEINGSGLLVGTSRYGARVTMQANGGFTYDPTNAAALQVMCAGESLVDSFTYTVRDDDTLTDTATVSITVTSTDAIEVNTSHEFVFDPFPAAPGVATPVVPGNDGNPDTVQFNLVGGNWEIRVNGQLLRTTSSTSCATEVQGSSDNDNIIFNGLGTGSIDVQGGGGSNSLTIDDSADTSGDNVTADGTSISGLIDGGATITHANIQTLDVTLTSDDDVFQTNAIGSGDVTNFTVHGDDGNDIFTLTLQKQM